jgi:hypothetical protein
MATQASNGWRVPRGRNSSTGAAVPARPEIVASKTDAGLSEEVLGLMEASRAACLTGQPTTGHVEGENRQLRVLAQIGAGKFEELITQTYIGGHEAMKLAVDNIAVALQGLQTEMARLTAAPHEGQLAERGKPSQFPGMQELKARLLHVLDTERTVNLAVKRVA